MAGALCSPTSTEKGRYELRPTRKAKYTSSVSIIITAVTPYAVIQVSDMQITAFRDGTITSARQRKSIVLKGQKVVALFGWTGLATIDGHNTGQWLHSQLDAMRAVDLSVVDIAKGLEDNATLHFATLPQTDKRCSFAIGGFCVTPLNTIEPFFCGVTNCGFGHSAKLSPRASVKFETSTSLISRMRPSKHPYVLTISGDEQTASELPLYWHGIRGLLKRRVGINQIAGGCLQAARAVANRQEEKSRNDPRFVKTVGRNLLAVGIDSASGVIQSLFFPEDGSQTQVLTADVLSPDLSTHDVVVESRINSDGNTEVKVMGWFKVDHLPDPSDPSMPLITFSGFPSTPMIGIGGKSPVAFHRTHEKD